MKSTFIVVLAMPLVAQVVAHLSPQPTELRGYTEYQVTLCSTTSQVLSGGLVYAAVQQRIVPVSRSTLQRALNEQAKRSPWRIAGLALESALWITTALVETEAIKIKEKWRTVAPMTAAGLRTLTTLTRKNVPATALPESLLPPLIQLAAGGCVEHSLFAREQAGEVPFSVVVDKALGMDK